MDDYDDILTGTEAADWMDELAYQASINPGEMDGDWIVELAYEASIGSSAADRYYAAGLK